MRVCLLFLFCALVSNPKYHIALPENNDFKAPGLVLYRWNVLDTSILPWSQHSFSVTILNATEQGM